MAKLDLILLIGLFCLLILMLISRHALLPLIVTLTLLVAVYLLYKYERNNRTPKK